MEYQKIINSLDNETTQPSKFRTKNWVEINYQLDGTYITNCQTKFKTTMLKSTLFNYSDAYILVKRTITVSRQGANEATITAKGINKQVIFKNRALFTDTISEINNTQFDNAKDLDIVMPICNLIEYSDKYAKTRGSLLHYLV